ncbi:MAG: YchF family ATPase [Planctomycetes bacterium]|nr:YchF family ATPase [Planctomycetota bacterium]
MRVALVGPPQSGKSTLFAAVAEAGGSHVDLSRPDQPHVAVVKVPDERLAWLAELEKSRKITPAELEFLDLPGFDLSDEAGRARARAHWQEMEQSDMLVFVVADFSEPAVAQYRGRTDPAADVEELQAEMLFADLERVTNRIEKLQAALRKPTQHRDEQARELELMRRLAEALEAEKPIGPVIQHDWESKLVRSFQFLTLKPAVVAVNCSEDRAAEPGPDELCGIPAMSISARIEEELAQLAPQERGEFLAGYGLAAPARDRLIRACYERLNLVSFLTAGPTETRAWTVPAGTDAVTAAGVIHSDIARGFIRAEVVAYDDLKAAGDMKTARAAGKVRQEGKGYIIRDGDVVHFKFNV